MKMDTRNNHTHTQQNRQTNDTHKAYIVLKLPVIDMHLKKIKHDSILYFVSIKKRNKWFCFDISHCYENTDSKYIG